MSGQKFTDCRGREFARTHASLPPTAPDKPRTIAGYWSVAVDPEGQVHMQWVGLTSVEPT